MPKGWQISFVSGGKIRIFIVAIAKQEDALAAVTEGKDPDGVVILPLKDGDFEKLALVEGQIIESAQTMPTGPNRR